jgi:hypothetical protein
MNRVNSLRNRGDGGIVGVGDGLEREGDYKGNI